MRVIAQRGPYRFAEAPAGSSTSVAVGEVGSVSVIDSIDGFPGKASVEFCYAPGAAHPGPMDYERCFRTGVGSLRMAGGSVVVSGVKGDYRFDRLRNPPEAG